MDRNARTALLLLLPLLAMIGLTAASVPLYDLFCRVTGYGGTTQVAEARAGAPSERVMTIRFDASTAKGLDWRFQPQRRAVTLRLGEEALAFYTATNRSDQPVVGTATFNVTPAKAGRYFNKIECFCFTEQRLEPGQSIDMPVTFFVDPAIAEDRNTDEITTITLSYTFFPVQSANGGGRS